MKNKERENKQNKKRKLSKKDKIITFVVLLFIIGGNIFLLSPKEEELEEKPFSEFVQHLNEKKIESINYSRDNSMIKVNLNDNEEEVSYLTQNPDYEDFKKDMLISGIRVDEYKRMSPKEIVSIGTSFSSLFLSVFIVAILIKLTRSGEDYSVKIEDKDEGGISSLAGFDELKEEVSLIVDTFKNRKEYEEKGIRPSKGLLLYGPTGTGKTKIAKFIASESSINFIAAKGSGFDQKFVGTGAARVRKLFETARKNAPCVLFIDEIDAIGTKRKDDDSAVYVQSLNALLEEMDGFSSKEGILVVAATNRIESLDPALLRPGRFDRKINVPLPSENDRIEIIKHYMKNIKTEIDFDEKYISDMTPGFSPAQIESLINEIMIESIRKKEEVVSKDSLERAFMKIQSGGYIKGGNKDKDPVIAYHESGHAVIGYLLNKDVRKVSIDSLSVGAGGYTLIIPKEDELKSKKKIEEDIMIMYAGRAAEQMYFKERDDITTGASEDIKRATYLIRSMVEYFGFLDDEIINLSGNSLSEKEKEENMRQMAKRIYEKTMGMVIENEEAIKKMSETLIKKNNIGKEEIGEIIESIRN